MKDPEANGAVLRKVGFNIKNSVFSQLLWAIEALGAWELWEKRVSVPELIYKPTGQRIIFIGGDNPKKSSQQSSVKGTANTSGMRSWTSLTAWVRLGT